MVIEPAEMTIGVQLLPSAGSGSNPKINRNQWNVFYGINQEKHLNMVWYKPVSGVGSVSLVAADSIGHLYGHGSMQAFATQLDSVWVRPLFVTFVTEYYIFGMTRDSFARVVPPPPDTTGKDTSAVGLFGGVYPNPFTESLTVTGAFERGGLEARLTNMLGQVVYEKVFTLTSTFQKIELMPPPLASGTYWLSLRQRNSQVGYKVLRR